MLNVFLVVSSTVIGGYMMETAQATAGSGRLTAIRQVVHQACSIIIGPTAGYLAAIAFGRVRAAASASADVGRSGYSSIEHQLDAGFA